jgi:hypothetical protein
MPKGFLDHNDSSVLRSNKAQQSQTSRVYLVALDIGE